MATILTPEVIPPSGTIAPNGEWRFVETSYQPRVDVTKDEVIHLEDNDLITGIKRSRKRTQDEMNAFFVYFDEAVARFKDVQPRGADGQFQSGTRPTLPQAFAAIGLKYETERKRKRRYLAASNAKERAAKPPSFEEGDIVQDAAGVDFIFISHPQPEKSEVVALGGNLEEAEIVPTASLVRRPIKKLEWNDLMLCADNNKVYRYLGGGRFQEEDNSDLLKQVRDRDNADYEAKQEKARQAEQAKANERAQGNSKLQAEVGDRDRSTVAAKPNNWPKACSDCGHKKEEYMKGRYCESCKKKRDKQKEAASAV